MIKSIKNPSLISISNSLTHIKSRKLDLNIENYSDSYDYINRKINETLKINKKVK